MTKEKQREILDKYSMIKSVEDCDTWVDDTISELLTVWRTELDIIETIGACAKDFIMCDNVNELHRIATELYNIVQIIKPQ